ncbi:MAG: hypothetical protein ABFS24_05990 [Pseudomonadota bacterium]
MQSARELDQFIEQIRKDYGAPELQVDLVTHSMGGLIARYYLRYGIVGFGIHTGEVDGITILPLHPR